MSNPQEQLMRCLIQTQIISANPVSSESVPLPNNAFSLFFSIFSFQVSFSEVSTCRTCAKMQNSFGFPITIYFFQPLCCLSLKQLICSAIVIFTFSSRSASNHSYLVPHLFACPIQRINYVN